MPNGNSHISLLVCWDFAAAFPSLAREWVWLVLRALALPQGLLNVIMALYHCCWAKMTLGGEACTLFCVLCGVLQGCPF